MNRHQSNKSSSSIITSSNNRNKLRIKLDKALTSINNLKQSQEQDDTYVRKCSKYFGRLEGNKDRIIEIDLKSWEDFYSYYIESVSQLFKLEDCNVLDGRNYKNIYEPVNIKIKEEEEEDCSSYEIKPFSEKFDVKIKLENADIKVHADLVLTSNWIPPRSPHNLIEETLYNHPWALLVSTIFLNRTSCMNARPYLMEFFKNYPEPETVLNVKPENFQCYFHKLGLAKKRSEQVWRMSYDYLHKNWKNVNELYGIGKYGEDAFKMFCLGDFNVEPNDRFLKIYKAWYMMQFKDENK